MACVCLPRRFKSISRSLFQLADDLERGRCQPHRWLKKNLVDYLRRQHGWDALASRRVVAFGPMDSEPTNALIDDLLDEDQEGDSAAGTVCVVGSPC